MGPLRPAADTGRVTPWRWARQTPLRRFLHTESSSAAALLLAAIAALAWANIDHPSYEAFRVMPVSVTLGTREISDELVAWINSGLMTLFFFVVGLEARRELDLGELRDRPRFVLPMLASLGGIACSVALFLLVNAAAPTAGGWGVAMSTDTAFALALLALAGPLVRQRLRGFLLTVVIVDDVVALLVIAIVYTDTLNVEALALAVGIYLVILAAVRLHIRNGLLLVGLAVAAWFALRASGVDPLVLGLALGLVPFASTGNAADLERVTTLFRRFREQPTPARARSAMTGINWAVSPHERLTTLLHPWTSYVIAPIFAFVNAGTVLNGDTLRQAAASPVTIGIVLGYVLGKPIGLVLMSWLVTRVSRGRLHPPVGWAAAVAAGTSSGIGFTVSLLVAAIAFDGQDQQNATIGILVAACASALLTAAVFKVSALLPEGRQARALVGTSEPVVDLIDPPDALRDHIRGPLEAPVTIVEYGDFQCPYCGRAEPIVRDLLRHRADVRYVWRHLPLTDVHPRAQLAAEAAEAAAEQGAFWKMHDAMLERQDRLGPGDLIGLAGELGLDADQFRSSLDERRAAGRIDEDIERAAASGVVGTPTFFVNGHRLTGAYDLAALTAAVNTAVARLTAQGLG